MSSTRYNLLEEQFFSIVTDGEEHLELSLPQVLAALGAGKDLEFAALRRHQHHAWFAFLVQLAAICAHRRGDPALDLSAGAWREALPTVAGGHEPWCLVVDDLSKPAFMQPPVPEGDLAVLKNEISTPDNLDVLLVTRNHDLKRTTITRARPEHWVFALVSLQTMQGFLGAGNYGISRMNGGFASRPAVALVAADDWADRFQRDASSLLAHRELLGEEPWPFQGTGGVELVWLEPWDGTDSIPMTKLDPLYIEICRRIRLCGDRTIVARAASSKAARIAGKERLGDTGDYWTPLKRENRASLTVPEGGFSYKLIQDLAFGGDWIAAPAQASGEGKGEQSALVARVLVRGQGETKGYHERLLPIPKPVRGFFATADGRDQLGRRAKPMVDLAAIARTKVLKPAVLALAQGGADDLNFKDKSLDAEINALDREIDRVFFSMLFEDVELSVEAAQARWEAELWQLVQDQFERIQARVSAPAARRYRALARAESRLHGAARKHLPNAFVAAETEPQNKEPTDELAHA